MAFEIILLSTY